MEFLSVALIVQTEFLQYAELYLEFMIRTACENVLRSQLKHHKIANQKE